MADFKAGRQSDGTWCVNKKHIVDDVEQYQPLESDVERTRGAVTAEQVRQILPRHTPLEKAKVARMAGCPVALCDWRSYVTTDAEA